MADVMQFGLVSPERSLFSAKVREVRMPGLDGDLTIMPGHASAMVTLRPGMITVIDEKGVETQFAVTAGFADITPEGLTLLAERGYPREEVTQDILNDLLGEVHRKRKAAEIRANDPANIGGHDAVTAIVKFLGDLEALGTHIGLDPKQANFPD